MSLNHFYKLMVVCVAIFNIEGYAQTNLLPGLFFYDSPESLTGKLVFLAGTNQIPSTNANHAAVYEFDLQKKVLHKVVDAPAGILIPSSDGGAFCVLYGEDPNSHLIGTNAFIYSEYHKRACIVSLGNPPRQTVVVSNHVFFRVESGDGKHGTHIVDYDIYRGAKQTVELPGASLWEFQDYKNLHVGTGDVNALHFEYSAYGKRMSDGEDYKTGYYAFDVGTGSTKWLSEKDNEMFEFQLLDGRFIFFEGPESPIHGVKLVLSPWDSFQTRLEDRKNENITVLTLFPTPPKYGAYTLVQMSPCRRYAVVCLDAPLKQESEKAGIGNTYYIVDVVKGTSQVLLEDKVEQQSGSFVSTISWVERGEGQNYK